MDFTYNEKTVMSSGGFIPSTNDTPLDARGRVNLYSEIKDIPNPYVGMEIRVLQDETNEGKMTKYKVTKLLSNEFGVPNSYIDTDTLEKISESLSDEDLVFDGICEDELGVITPQLKTDYNLTTTDKTIVGAINELKEALANITIGDNGETVNLPFNSIDKGLASSNIDFSEIKNGNYCYIIRGTIGYDIPDGNLPLNNDMVHITKSNTAMTIITLSGGIYTYNGGTNGTDYISCTKDNFMTYSVASETYQLKNDSKLITTDKTVVGAINELKNALDSGVNGVSTILTVSPTYEELDTLPEGSKVYILNGLGYNGDPVHINKSSNTITLIGIDGAINKYQKVGNSWSNYSTENWATQKYVDTAIANVQLGGESGSVDLSEYQKITDSSLATTNKNIVGAINEVKSSVDGITVPTKTSDLTNDSGFITSIPSEYITETELETKGYLTEHQSLTDYAKKIDIPDVSDFLTEVPEGYVTDTKLSTELDKKVNKEVGKGLSTNDLTNELVTKINSSATEAFVTNAIANAQLGSGEVDLSGYATVDALNLKADLTHTHDQYLTKVPDEYITETELTTKGYLTEHQDISNLALKSEIPDVSSFITSDDLPTVPTKVSDLANDKNYISSIPSEYITETELNAKGYLTSHQDISGLQTKTDNSLTTTSKKVVGAINEVKASVDGITVPTIATSISYESSNTQTASPMSVYTYAIKGKLISQTDIDTYGTEIVKFPLGKWIVGSVAISNLTDLPNTYVRYVEILGVSETNTPWNSTNSIRSYRGTSYKGDVFVRSLSSGDESGVISFDTGWQRVLLNGDITTTIDSTSVDTQVPSAKAVYSATVDKNLKTYTSIEQLGLTTPTTVEDIYNALPTNSCLNSFASLSSVTDLPLQQGLLSITKINTSGFDIIFKRSGSGSVADNTMYIGQLKGIDGTSLRWKKVCTTTVADVPVTSINIINGIVNPECKYQVKNGICYIQFNSGTYSLGENVSGLQLATGLPIPSLGQVSYTYVPWASGDASKQVIVFVDRSGSLLLHALVGANESPVFCSFSYPVAES